MNLDKIHSVYFVGIGGIGMSALARWFHAHGRQVAGYDKTNTALTKQLQDEGIEVQFTDDASELPAYCYDQNTTLVIYTPAVPVDNKLLSFFQRNHFTIKKRAEVLGVLSASYHTLAVAGTHGKTTTTTMLAHILYQSGVNCSAFFGGISANYDTNMLLGQHDKELTMVVEADEFDRSFLHLTPDMVAITATDADHLDIYGDGDKCTDAFREFAGQLRVGGQLIVHEDVAGVMEKYPYETYGVGAECDIKISNERVEDGKMLFDVTHDSFSVSAVELPLPGHHNVLNATAAIAMASFSGVSEEEIKQALKSFKGIKRRFEIIAATSDCTFIDDYAHHPKEIDAFIDAVRLVYPDQPLTVIFQPHLFSRTRDFMRQFAQSLSKTDRLILLPIYPAREEPITGITSDALLEMVAMEDKQVTDKASLIDMLNPLPTGVIATLGAGDIDQSVKPIKQLMMQQHD